MTSDPNKWHSTQLHLDHTNRVNACKKTLGDTVFDSDIFQTYATTTTYRCHAILLLTWHNTLYAPGEECLSHIPTCHCSPHVRLKHLWVVSQHCSCFSVQGILMIRLLQEKKLQLINTNPQKW